MTQFRLEENHQNDCAVLDHGCKEPVECCKTDHIADQGGKDQKAESLENGASACMSNEHQDLIENHCHDHNIQYICQPQPVNQIPVRVLQCLHTDIQCNRLTFISGWVPLKYTLFTNENLDLFPVFSHYFFPCKKRTDAAVPFVLIGL